MDRLARWACWGVAAVGLASGVAPARAQWGVTPPGSPAGPAMSPLTNPYMNPYMNPYLYSASAPRGGVGAAWMVMGMQQSQAEAARLRAEARGEGRSRGVPRGAMSVPGGGAARYFGGGAGGGEESALAPPGGRGNYFLQHDRYFRPNGH